MPHHSDRCRLTGLLLLAWCAGFLSALGIGIVRGAVSTTIVSGGGIAGLVFLIAVGLGCVLEVLAFASMRAVVRRSRGARDGSGRAAVAVLAAGGIGMAVLSLILVSGPFLPPFGPVSTVLLCLPYPLAFALLEVRDLGVALGAGAAALLLAGCVIPVHAMQEHLAARAWLNLHPGQDRALLQAVDWPGGEQDPFTTGSYGVRTTVFFPDTNIDGNDDGVVTVAPATNNPCGPAAAIATDDNTPENDRGRIGTVVTLPVTRCTPDGKDAWTLHGSGFTGYALRRDGVLVTVCADSERARDDLPAVARALHPLDDHQLWTHLSLGWAPTWLAM
ncbi:hypothetical protein GCM10010430_50350 [Kitasatospora cystarginea]|uniref:Uncharacterized protein n=1 Tax=Kitasatospora cystarginea TaxID=58350 RepID=A0ABN3EII3_9ACTN